MSTTPIYIGFEGQKPSSRVLKPPGGGSSILFDEPDGFHFRPSKSTVQTVREKQSAVTNGDIRSAPKCDSGMSSGSASPTPSGSITPSSNGNSASSSISSTPVPSSPQSKVPPMPEIIESEVKSNKTTDPFPEISKLQLDDVPIKMNDSLNVGERKTPVDLPKQLSESQASPESKQNSPDTKGRLFGQENSTPGRVIIDRMKSNIFVFQDESRKYVHHNQSPEVEKVEQQQSAPRQRIPPGGFSSKLW